MPLQATSGAASYDAFGGGVPVVPNYIEDVFSTYLYEGTGASQTITNNIDLSTKGGLTWIKGRSGATGHRFTDTARGVTKSLASNATTAEATESTGLTAFGTTGFTIGADADYNTSAATYTSWTFRKQPKFFDIVTFSGDGRSSGSATINHSLGVTPAVIIFRQVNGNSSWQYGTNFTSSDWLSLFLNNTNAGATTSYVDYDWFAAQPTSTTFTVGWPYFAAGATYVAYLFASNAGGFGLTGTDNVISCGSFSSGSPGSNTTVNLGYEPQWIIFKNTQNASEGWWMYDTMRGWTGSLGTAGDKYLFAESSGAEGSITNYINVTSTGFVMEGGAFATNETYIYIAIRRGPMKVPTSGTSVFEPQLYTGTGTTLNVTGPTNAFQYDSLIQKGRSGDLSNYAGNGAWTSKLQKMSTSTGGESRFMGPATTLAETAGGIETYTNVGFTISGGSLNIDGTPYVNYWLRRAPSFFDEVCYTGGTGTPRVLSHNLAVAPELVITKIRNFAGEDWVVNYSNGSTIIGGYLNSTAAFSNSSTAPSTDITSLTSTTYTLNTSNRRVNGAYNYVAYLFATCAGVSKCTSFTGTGTLQTIDCGFTSGSRFVLIKRTDSTGDWYVWDSSRGLSSSTDPYLLLNSTAAEVTSTNWVDTTSTGFQVTAASGNNVNINGASYIALAIA